MNLEINELELEEIEYYLDKLSDDFYSMAEAAQYLVGTFSNGDLHIANSKLDNILSNT
jgi:hypothetical protein